MECRQIVLFLFHFLRPYGYGLEKLWVGVNVYLTPQFQNFGQSSGMVIMSMAQKDFLDGPQNLSQFEGVFYKPNRLSRYR